ncbi:MAG: 50S ribosomal protein L25 [Ignavibacterium sp.]
METVKLNGKIRAEISKSARSKLRRDGNVPGVLYSKNIESISFSVKESDLNRLTSTSGTHVISLNLENNSYDCIIKDVQYDPVTDKVVHFDLLGLVSGEKIEVEIPVAFIGTPIGVREGGLLQEFFHKLNVECLPTDIPENIEIDLSNLNIGDSIHISDILTDKFTIKHSPETVIASVAHPRSEVETETTEETITEPEVISKGKEKEEKEEE